MALTTATIHANAIPRSEPFTLEDEDGLYLLVRPDGTMLWHLTYPWDGQEKHLELGPYPELSLSDVRKQRVTVQRLLSQGIAPAKDSQEGASALPLIAYRLNNTPMPLVTGSINRDWMDRTPSRFAYRCMPMLIANQSGWLLLSDHDISIEWDGRQSLDALTITCLSGDPPCPALSVFGSGIITFTLSYLFRTPPGYNLIAQGPANMPKDGVSPLSGVIETDWAESTFTMNWMMTRPHHRTTFQKGEPICMILPQRRYEIEQFRPVIRDIGTDPVLHADYLQWAESRKQFNQDLNVEGSQARKDGWQKHYAQGKTITNKRSDSHQSKLTLADFIDETQ